MAPPLLLLLSFLAAAPRVVGELTCPASAEVEARVAALLPEAEGSPGHLVRLEHGPAGIRVQMRAATGELLAERTVPSDGPCERLASTIAVVIAAWEAELRPGELPMPVLPPPPPVRPSAPPQSREWTLGAGVSLTAASATPWVVPGIGLEASLGPVDRGLGALVALDASAPRQLPLGSGHVRWQRFALAAGPRYRLAVSPRLEFHLAGLGALLSVRGVGYLADLAQLGVDLGVGGGARLAFAQGPLAPWMKLEARGWLRRQEAQVTGVEGQVVLPNLELMLTAGVSVGWM